MKSSKRGTRYIKRVELIPDEEFKTIGVFQSMIERFVEHTPFKGHDHNMRMVVTTPNGDLKTMEIEEIVSRKEDFIDSFSDGRTLCAVKIFWSDGTWEYGLKSWNTRERVYQKNCKLRPLFAKIGIVNEESNEIEDILDIDVNYRFPAWILELIPRYNERIHDGIEKSDDSIETKTISIQDWMQVENVIFSDYMSSQACWEEISVGGKKVKLPIDVIFDNRSRDYNLWEPNHIELKETLCNEKWGIPVAMLDKQWKKNLKVFCYTYVKSIYFDNCKRVKEYKVIPLSDVLMLKSRKWNNLMRDYEETEVWNSLDETCKGNV